MWDMWDMLDMWDMWDITYMGKPWLNIYFVIFYGDNVG